VEEVFLPSDSSAPWAPGNVPKRRTGWSAPAHGSNHLYGQKVEEGTAARKSLRNNSFLISRNYRVLLLDGSFI